MQEAATPQGTPSSAVSLPLLAADRTLACAGTALLLLLVALGATRVSAQSTSPATTRPSAQVQAEAAPGNPPALPAGVLSGVSVPEPGSFHEETVNAHLQAGTPHELSAEETARQQANPNSPLASLTLKNQLRWYDGDLPGADDQFNYTALFQPVFPLTLPEASSGGKANLFVRPAFPILIEQPVFDAANARFKGASGLGDIGFDIGYGVTEKSGFLWHSARWRITTRGSSASLVVCGSQEPHSSCWSAAYCSASPTPTRSRFRYPRQTPARSGVKAQVCTVNL